MAVKTENLAILFTDIAGFTEATSRQSREENQKILAQHNSILLPIVKGFKGRHVKSIGDALLLTFKSPTDAMLCAMAMQDALHEYNQTVSVKSREIHIRIAASLGEVRVTKGDIFGEPVNVTSRIEGITPADEIYFSEAVYLAMNKAEVPTQEVGRESLKGISKDIRIYSIPRFATPRLVDSAPVLQEEPTRSSQLQYPFGGAHLEVRSSRSGGVDEWMRMPMEMGRRVGPFWSMVFVFVLLGSVSLLKWGTVEQQETATLENLQIRERLARRAQEFAKNSRLAKEVKGKLQLATTKETLQPTVNKKPDLSSVSLLPASRAGSKLVVSSDGSQKVTSDNVQSDNAQNKYEDELVAALREAEKEPNSVGNASPAQTLTKVGKAMVESVSSEIPQKVFAVNDIPKNTRLVTASVAKKRPAYTRFSSLKSAYRAGKITRDYYNTRYRALKIERKERIIKLKLDYRAGKMSKVSYKERYRALVNSYE